MNGDVGPLHLFTRKLEGLKRLDSKDRETIASLPITRKNYGPDHSLIREGERADRCCLLVSGYACRHKIEATGGRQIISFHLPGDLLDAQHLLLDRADHNIETVGPVSVAWIPKQALQAAIRNRPALAEALWRDTLIDASIFREWVLNVGRRDAKARIAHMLCEFAFRCEHAGLGNAANFVLPMSQEQIADATGLTPVHVNRTLQQIGNEGVIVRRRREIEIVDWDRFCLIAGFDPGYLHAAA